MADNVLPLPTRVERLVKLIQGDLQRQANGDREWIEGSYDLCLHLVELREQFTADIEFGAACEAYGFGKGVLNRDTRASAVAMGREPEALRKCLEATTRRSLEMIYRREFDRFRSTPKPTRAPRKQPEVGPQEQRALDVYDRLTAEGRTFTRPDLAEEADVSPGTAARAYNRRQLEEKVHGKIEPLDPAASSKTMQKRLQAWERQTAARLEKEISDRLNAEYSRVLEERTAFWRQKYEEAKKIKGAYRGVMPKRDYLTIVKCLHPDTQPDPSRKAEAFRIFTGYENLLVKPEPKLLDPRTPPLPETAADLMRAREEARAARRAAKEKV